jgi:hypothetical protein
MSAPPATLADYADEELRDFYSASTDEQWHQILLAEADRRDAADKARQAPREADLRGELALKDAPFADAFALWRGTEAFAMKYATEELKEWWREVCPRQTVTAYRDQERHQREEYRNEQLAHDDAQPIRHASPAARPGRDVPDAGPVRHSGHVRPDRRRGGAVNIARTVIREAGYAAELRRRADAIRQDRAAAATGTLAVREGSTVAGQLPEVDGAELLGHVSAYLARFARFPTTAALDAAVLWAAHCHARDSEGVMIWSATPRLMMLSRERGSGKTTVLELLARLVPVCHGIDVEPSMAGVTYSLGREKAVIALDESDILFGAGRRKADLRAVINAGYTRHGTVLRMRGGKGERVPVFGPVMLAGLDVVEQATGGVLDTLLSRSIIIRMAAPPEGEEPADMSDPGQHAEEIAERGRKLLAVWSLVNRDKLAAAQPEMPDGVRLRAAQIWRPLLAVAEVAGGEWPGRAAAACAELTQAHDATPAGQADQLLDELAAMTAGW